MLPHNLEFNVADIEIMPNVGWNAKAAAGDALNRASLRDPFIAIWVDDKGQVRYSQANMDSKSLAFITQFLIAKNTLTWISNGESEL